MPVSPQDFAIWSDLTGNAYPQTPAERMALAPEVYRFTRGIGRRGGYGMSPVRKAVDVIGKTALVAGAIAGAAYLGSEGFKKLQLDDEPDVSPPVDSTGPTDSVVPVEVVDMSPQTTAENYNQNFLPLQTRIAGLLRGVSPAKPTVVDSEEKPATQSHVIASSQTFSPGSELEQLSKSAVPHTPVRDRADELIAEFLGGVAAEERAQKRIDKSIAEYQAGVAGRGEPVLKSVLAEGRAEGISPAGTRIQRAAQTKAAEAFRQTPEYVEMMKSAGASMEPESSPVYFTEVRATPETRITGAKPVSTESAIIEMVRPQAEPEAVKVTAPVAVASPVQVRRNAESEEAEAFARKALGLMPRSQGAALLKAKQPEAIVTSQPESVRVSEDIGDTTAKLLRQAKAMRTSREEAGGMLSQDIPSGPIHNISVSPANEVAVTYKTKAGAQTYNFDADPKYVNELVDRIQRGTFVKGQDSAGGFINAGRSMGLLQ